MSIEQIIKYLPAPICGDTVIGKEKQKEYEAHDSAVIILRKYQKIQEIIQHWIDEDLASESPSFADSGTIEDIIEVIEDGNDD